MKKSKLNLPLSFVRRRPLLLKLIIVLIIVFISALFIVRNIVRFLKTSDYFKIKDIMLSEENIVDLSYLKGENIFTVDLEKESLDIAQQYPNYRKVRLIKVLPNRIFVNFTKRRPVGLVKLYRYFYVDEEAVLFNVSPQLENKELPVILGLETKIFGPQAGRKYNIKELTVALNIIKELNLNKALKDYKIKKIDVADLSNTAFFMLVPLPISDYTKGQVVTVSKPISKGQATGGIKELEIRLDIDEIKDKINIFAGLITQVKNEWGNIKYIDLRFKEPVIKLNDAK